MGQFGLALAGGAAKGFALGQQQAQERALQKQELDIKQKKFKLEEQESGLKIKMLQQQIEQQGGVMGLLEKLLGGGQQPQGGAFPTTPGIESPSMGQPVPPMQQPQGAGMGGPGGLQLEGVSIGKEGPSLSLKRPTPERPMTVAPGATLVSPTGQTLFQSPSAPREPIAPEARIFQEAVQRHKATGLTDEQAFTKAKDELAEFRAKSAGGVTAAKQAETPVPAEIANKVADLNNILRIVDTDILPNFKSDYVGPAAGRLGGVKRSLGMTDAQESVFRAAVADIADMLLRARSGAQINEQEYQRLLRIAPNLNMGVEDFVANLHRFRQVAESIMSDKLRLATTPKKGLKGPQTGPTAPIPIVPKKGGKLKFNPQTGVIE